MKAPDDKGLRAMAFYECIHPKIKLTEQDEQDQRMSDCSHEQNSTTGILKQNNNKKKINTLANQFKIFYF